MTDFPLGTQGTQSHSQGSSFGGDFDAARGVVPIRRTDLVMSGSSGFPIAPSRTYNNWTVNHSANIDGNTVLGPRWHFNYDMAIQSASGASDIFLRTSSGGQEILYSAGTDIWKGNTENGGPIKVVKSASAYTLTQPDPEIVYTFNLNGKLSKIRTKNGHVQTLTRDANGLLTRIDMDHEDPAKDIDSRYVTFHYDTYTTFTGLAPGSYTRLKKVQSSEGPLLLYEYDANGMLLETKDDRSQRIEAYWNNTSNTSTGNQVPLIVALYAGDGKGGSIEKRNYGYWNGNTMSWMASTPWNNRVYELAGTAYENMVYKSTATDLFHGTKTVYSVNLSRDPVKIQVLRSSDLTTLQKTEQVYVPGTLANFNVPGQMRDSLFPRHLLNAAGRTTTFEYLGDSNPNATEWDKIHVLAEVASDGSRTEYEYDSAYRVTAVKRPFGRTTRMAYDARGNMIWKKNSTGKEWVYTYDDLGRVTAIEDPTSATAYYAYNTAGQVTITTDTQGRVRTKEYDSRGRLITTTLLGVQTVFGYDSLDRLVSKTRYPGGVQTFREYDALNRVTTTTDELKRKTVYEYSPTRGTLASVTNPDGGKIYYEYDAFGRLTKVTDERGKVTAYAYDLMGRLVSETNPLGKTSSTTYKDGAGCGSCGGNTGSGRVATSTSFSGQQRIYTYDSTGRLVAVEWAGTTDRVDLAFDSRGRLTTATDTRLPLPDLGGQSFVYGYDSDDQVTTVTYPDGAQVSYEYDQYGRRTKMTDPDGNVTEYTYSTAVTDKRLILVGHTCLGGVAYNYNLSDGLLGSITYGGNMSENGYLYDSLKRLSGVEISNPDWSSTWHKETYTYNSASMRTRINVSATGLSSYELRYGYDSLRRLTDEYKITGATQNWGRKYGYDAAGNRTSLARHDGFSTTTITYDPANNWNQILADSEHEYIYDDDGNMIAREVDGSRIYRHDREGRLTTATLPGSQTVSYAYDASGRLLLRVAPDGRKEKYYYGLSRVLVKELPSGGSTWRTKRVYALRPGSISQVYGERENTAWSGSTPTAWTDRWLHYDMLGNVVLRTDSSGQVTDRYDMDAYGNVLSGSAYGLHLTTKERDPDTGLYWFGARWYDPVTGRWIEKEPSGMDGPNLYWFARGSATTGYDPDGLTTIVIGDEEYNTSSGDASTVFSNPMPRPRPRNCFDAIIAGIEVMLRFPTLPATGPTAYGPPGGADKVAHCMMLCELAKGCPDWAAYWAGYAKEAKDHLDPRGTGWDAGDLQANSQGVNCANSCPEKSCEDCCREYY